MSDHEDESFKPTSSESKPLKLRRLSMEIEVTELVKLGKLQSKSDDLKRKERFYASYETELEALDQRKIQLESEISKYETLKFNMEKYFANEMALDMDLEDHRLLSAFLKKHVSSKVTLNSEVQL